MKLSTALEVLPKGMKAQAFVHDDDGRLIGEAYADEYESWVYSTDPKKHKPRNLLYSEVMRLDWFVGALRERL